MSLRFFINGMRNLMSPAAAVLVLALMAAGAGAALIAAGVVAFAGFTLVTNPFGLLDGFLSRKTRWCWAVGVICVYAACIVPVRPSVRLALILLAFGLIAIGWTQNQRFLENQVSPVMWYSKEVGKSLSSLRTGEKNLSKERILWRSGGMEALQTVLMMRGIPFNESTLRDMEEAFVVGAEFIEKDNNSKEKLEDRIWALERENQSLKNLLEEEKNSSKEIDLYDDYVKAEKKQEEWRKRALLAEEQALRYADRISRDGGITDSEVWEMLDNGMTGREIAEETGLSPATVSRIKNRREVG